MSIIKKALCLLLLSAGGFVDTTEAAEAAEFAQWYHATKEGEKIILSPVSVLTAPNITIIYDRDNHKPKSIVLGPKLIKTDGKTIVLSDGSVLM